MEHRLASTSRKWTYSCKTVFCVCASACYTHFCEDQAFEYVSGIMLLKYLRVTSAFVYATLVRHVWGCIIIIVTFFVCGVRTAGVHLKRVCTHVTNVYSCDERVLVLGTRVYVMSRRRVHVFCACAFTENATEESRN